MWYAFVLELTLNILFILSINFATSANLQIVSWTMSQRCIMSPLPILAYPKWHTMETVFIIFNLERLLCRAVCQWYDKLPRGLVSCQQMSVCETFRHQVLFSIWHSLSVWTRAFKEAVDQNTLSVPNEHKNKSNIFLIKTCILTGAVSSICLCSEAPNYSCFSDRYQDCFCQQSLH